MLLRERIEALTAQPLKVPNEKIPNTLSPAVSPVTNFCV